MSRDPAFQFFDTAWAAMQGGDLKKLEDLTHLSPFPCATDGWLNARWLTHAIHSGNADAVLWVLSKGCDASYVDDDGNTLLKAGCRPRWIGRTAAIRRSPRPRRPPFAPGAK